MAAACDPCATVSLMRHRFDIKRETTSIDSGGFGTQAFSTLATVWGAIEPLSAREQWEAHQERADATHRITIRHRTDVKTQDRVAATLHSQSRTWRILGIRRLPNEEARFLELLCGEEPVQ